MLNQTPFHTAKLRVLAVSPALLPGGAEQQLTTLIKHSVNVKYTSIVTINTEGQLHPELEANLTIPHHKIVLGPGESNALGVNRGVSTVNVPYDCIFYWGMGEIDLTWTGVPVVHVSHASGVEVVNQYHTQWLMKSAQSKANFHIAVCESGKKSSNK